MDVILLNTWSIVGLIVDALIVVWLLLSLMQGAKNGFVYSLLGLGTFALALLGAWFISDMVADPLTKLIFGEGQNGYVSAHMTVSAARQIVRVGAGILVAILLSLVLRILSKGISRALNNIPIVGGLNQLLGLVLAGVVTLALVMALLLAWETFFPDAYRNVMKGAPVMRFAHEHNLIARWFGK